MYKVDLHTHSTASADGGIRLEQYAQALALNQLDSIAITDHNRIDMAQFIKKELGDRIIVGEEIMTTGGEIIGLYLKQPIRAGLSPLEAVQQIKEQEGVVYIPHPFESVRSGVHPQVLEELIDYVDLIEVCNGRAFLQNRSAQAVIWAKLNHVIGVASSDAHGSKGLGKTYTRVSEVPSDDNLLKILAHGVPVTDRPGIRALLYPKYHRLRKKLAKK